ncbi:MAG TPA: PP2C family protein-serine/threonine phosphatase [Solirubrobacteraceae bacterium]|nr:PP2C family protein-serine/threonine phosphatase [Solirubrobacteraceae bacterium]
MLARAPTEVAPTDREANWAVGVAAGLYLVGGLLCATGALLPELRAPAAIAAVGVVAVTTAALLFEVWHHERGTLTLAFVADLWGIVLIATLCAGSSGASSPFALIYMFAIGHAAAFQPRGRLYVVVLIALVAFLSPIVYEEGVSTLFAAVACMGIVLGVLTCAAVHFALNRIREQRRRLQVLSSASASLDRSLDPAETLRAISRMAVPELVPVCVVDVLDGTGSIGSTVAAATDPALAERIEVSPPGRPLTKLPLDGVSDLLDEQPNGHTPRRIAGPVAHVVDGHEHASVMDQAGYICEVAFPMLARGRIHGMISFWRPREERPFDRGLVTVLEDLSGRAALAYDNARLYAERAQVARTLRRSLMPAALPTIPGLELASYFRPMGAGSEVGGDFYDVLSDDEGCWLIVGDVCGKGAEAAALTGFVRHTTAAYARETDRPGRVLTRVNRAMLEQDFEGCFATAILTRMSFRPSEVEVTVALAGHPAALIARSDGDAGELGASGKLLGVFPDADIEEAFTVMKPGDALALYTDGLTEAHAPSRVLSVGQMIERLRNSPRRSPQDAIDALLGLIGTDTRVGDDIAILAAQVAGGRSLGAAAAQRERVAAG